MSSIPSSVMPHALAPKAEAPAPTPALGTHVLGFVLAPPILALGLGVMAFGALRGLASDLARKVNAAGGSAEPVPDSVG